MKKKNRSIRILCLLLAVMTVLSVFPMSVSAACSHTHTTKVWDSSISTKATGHQYMTHCNDCGEDIKGWGKSGWKSHSFGSWIKGKRSCSICGYSETCSHNWQDNYNGTKHCTICGTNESAPPHTHTWSDGKCPVCGYTCSHLSKTTQWTNSGGAPTSTGHGYNTVCNTCGKVFTGAGYSGWASHSYGSWSGGKHSCTVCGYSETCSHSSWSSWVKSTRTCKTCGMTETCTSHHWQDNYKAGDPEACLLYEQLLEKERENRLLHPYHKKAESGTGGKKKKVPLTDEALIEKYESDLAKKREDTRSMREKQKAAMQAATASTQEAI